MTNTFKASWSVRVKLLTVLGTVVLLGEAVLLWVLGRWLPQISTPLAVSRWLFMAVLGSCAWITVRRYSLDGGTLIVQRLFWTTELPLDGLSSVAWSPAALRITVEGFGNSGLFAILGWRYVRAYGWCRVFGTNPANAVVLRCNNTNYIVTPDNPDAFIREATQLASGR
jgi:hypothetical protein